MRNRLHPDHCPSASLSQVRFVPGAAASTNSRRASISETSASDGVPASSARSHAGSSSALSAVVTSSGAPYRSKADATLSLGPFAAGNSVASSRSASASTAGWFADTAMSGAPNARAEAITRSSSVWPSTSARTLCGMPSDSATESRAPGRLPARIRTAGVMSAGASRARRPIAPWGPPGSGAARATGSAPPRCRYAVRVSRRRSAPRRRTWRSPGLPGRG